MQSLIPTTEFDGKTDVFSRIKGVLRVNVARPYGKRLAAVMEYLNRYTEDQINTALDKLSESKWVNNPQFSYDRLMKDDIIGTMLSGGMSEQVSKYYNVVILEV